MNRWHSHLGATIRRRWLITRWLCTVLLVATCLLVLGHSAAAAPRQPRDSFCQLSSFFVHTASAANSYYDYTLLDDPLTNGCPQSKVFVTASFTPGGVYDTHPLGVWYSGSTARWSVFHEDKTPIPPGATYNIFSLANTISDGFIQTATTANSQGDETLIDNPLTNNQPDTLLYVTPNWSVGYVYDPHPLGVWYWGGHWIIFHEDGTPLPVGTSYNVDVTVPNAYAFLQAATAANSAGDWTEIDNEELNDNPYAIPLVTANWSGGGVFDPHVLGMWYDTVDGRWTIFHEDRTPIPVGATYNITALS